MKKCYLLFVLFVLFSFNSFAQPEAIFTVTVEEYCIGEGIVFYSGLSVNATEYYWDFGDGTNSGWISDETAIHAYTSIGWMTVTLTVRDEFGVEDYMTDDIHILGSEVIIDISNYFGCNSLEVTFVDQSIADEVISMVTLDYGDGVNDIFGGGATFTHTYEDPGTYTVTAYVITTSDCFSEKVYTDTITVGSVSPMFSASLTTACGGEVISFTATENDPLYTYTWNFGDGTYEVGSNPTPTHVYSIGGIYDVSLEVDNNAGCVEDVTYVSYITIEEVEASFTVSDQECYPAISDISPTINVLPTGTSLTYYWDMGNGDISEVEDPEILYTFPGVYTIELTVSTSNGCTTIASNYITIDGPWADVSISSDSICIGEAIDFEITNIQNVESNNWIVGGGDVYFETSFTHTYDVVPPLGYYTTVLTLTSGMCEIVFPTDVYVFDIPEPVIVSGGGNQFGGQAELIATGGDNGVIYWQGTTSNGTSTEIESNSEIVYDNGTYYFRAVNGIGCWGAEGEASVIIVDSIEIVITVNDASENNVADGSIAADITGGTEPYTVTCTSAKSNHSFTELLQGDYTLNVVDALGNSESEDFSIGVLNSISTNEIVYGIYPNPARNIVVIEIESHIPEHIKVYDLLGQEVFCVNPNSRNVSFDVSGFISGVYFVKILVDGRLITEKLVID